MSEQKRLEVRQPILSNHDLEKIREIGDIADNQFMTITLDITAKTDMDPDTLESFKEELEKRCPMSVILRQAGTEIVQNWTFVE